MEAGTFVARALVSPERAPKYRSKFTRLTSRINPIATTVQTEFRVKKEKRLNLTLLKSTTPVEDDFYRTFDSLMQNKVSWARAADRNETKFYLTKKPVARFVYL